MAKFPREEISYKKLYKSLDLDRDLGIEWQEIARPSREGTIELGTCVPVERRCRTLDEFDESFCRERSLDESLFLEALEALDQGFTRFLFGRLDQVRPVSSPGQPCDICGGTDQEEGNTLLTCTGCAVAVHQECYGVPEPVWRFWFCSKCLFYDEEGSCFLCNNKNGVLKRTTDLRWVHAVCAILNPSLSFANLSFKDPVDTGGLRKCRGRCGCCSLESETLIRCAYFKCRRRYHASCASERLYCDLNNKCVYCLEHDFSLDSKMIISRRKLLSHRSSYPLLEHDVFIRKTGRLTAPVETMFSQIVRTAPFDVDKAGSHGADVTEYWIAKRKAFGTSFSDIFLYVNYLNKQA